MSFAKMVVVLLGMLLCLSGSSCSQSGAAEGSWKKLTTLVPQPSGGAYTDVHFVSRGVGYVCGYGGFLAKTTDGGTTWTKIEFIGVPGVDNGTMFADLHFVSENEGWLIGNGSLLHTTNAGVSWTQTMPQTPDRSITSPQSVWFGDPLHGAVVGMYGKALYTADGGATWLTPTMDSDYATGVNASDFKSVFFVNANVGWIAGSRATLLKTVDGGKSWTALNSMSTSVTANALTGDSPGLVQFLDENNGYLAGAFSMYKTSDGGKTWAKLAGAPKTVTFRFTSERVGFADSDSLNGISATSDGGATWAVQAGGVKTGQMRGMSFLGNLGWAVTGEGGVYQYRAN